MDSHTTNEAQAPNDVETLLKDWQPEPLVPEIDAQKYEHFWLNSHVATSKPGKYITIDGEPCLNLGTNNYLGLADHPRLEDVSIAAVRKYGVGACGPRGFYGTMDIHLALEQAIAKFLNVQETVLYAFGFSTIASAIPAYAKNTDIIFVDEQCNFAIQQGINASRAKVVYFRHNDAQHCEQLVEATLRDSKKNVRTFLIAEAIYAKTGQMCPLEDLVRIKQKYKIRLFLEESNTFGLLGSKGKGLTEYLNVDINDLDMIMVSLEHAMCGYGGFCAGTSYVIDHQRLAGVGYCFSASLPPLQTQVALESLKIISENPGIAEKARDANKYAHKAFARLTHLRDISDPVSPVKILVPKKLLGGDSDPNVDNEKYEKRLTDISDDLLRKHKIALPVDRFNEHELIMPPASMRASISACLTREDIDRVVDAIEQYTM